MRYLPRAILAGGLGFAVSILIAACGGGAGLLSSDQSSTLSDQLNQVSTNLAAGNCSGVANAATGLDRAVGSLPTTVNVTLRNNLIQGASTVSELAARDCHPTTSTPGVTSTTTPSVTTSTTAPTSSAQSSTSTTSAPPTTSSTSSTPATTPTTPGTTSTGGTGGAGLGSGGVSGPGVATPGGGNSGNGK